MPRIVFFRTCHPVLRREFARPQQPIPDPKLCEPCDEEARLKAAPFYQAFGFSLDGGCHDR
jgi:hypothetical protein